MPSQRGSPGYLDGGQRGPQAAAANASWPGAGLRDPDSPPPTAPCKVLPRWYPKEQRTEQTRPRCAGKSPCCVPHLRPMGVFHLGNAPRPPPPAFPAQSRTHSRQGFRSCRPCRTFPLPPWRGWALTSNGLRGGGPLLQAPLTPGTQGFLPLHLRGRLLGRHQGLCSWGHSITSLGVFFPSDCHPDALGVRSTADCPCQGGAPGGLGSCGGLQGTPTSSRPCEQRSDQHPGHRGG